MSTSSSLQSFLDARKFLQDHREDYDAVSESFQWPELDEFNWALDWFDSFADGNDDPALWIVQQDSSEAKWSFQQMSQRSNQVANWLRSVGVKRGDRIILMLGNQLELWETILAAMKLGAVLIPSTPQLGAADLQDRLERGNAGHVVVGSADVDKFDSLPGDYTRIAVGEQVEGWLDYSQAYQAQTGFTPEGVTRATDTLLLYFTSGTTAKPKLVEHTHASYPVGHLSTMYWIGLAEGDIHLNISSPGWAKHAWSNVFAPWIAGCCVFIYNYSRFDPAALMHHIDRCGVTSLCAPPTVWRILIQSDLSQLKNPPRSMVGAGEPLNPEVIEQIQRAWDRTIRDGFGQTETSVLIANTPGNPVKNGSMGRVLPGFTVALVDPATGELGEEGEICLDLSQRPMGLMVGYNGSPDLTAEVMRDGFYHTGDVASRDPDGYITYVGRSDDVFKASDYRISPFELESVLLEHEAVAEAAVVPSPDPVRLAVPKAYITLAAGKQPDAETARSILLFAKQNLPPFKRIRLLEFNDLPKTISGKIRRVELRGREKELHAAADAHPEGEFRLADLDPDAGGASQ